MYGRGVGCDGPHSGDFGGVRSLLLLPLRAVAAAPCAARPVAGGLDGDQERESWSTLQHPGLLEKEGVLLLAGNFGGVVHEEYVIAELVDVRLMSMSWRAWS